MTSTTTEPLDRYETIELLLDYYQQPRNQGQPANSSISLSGRTPGCSDQLTLYITTSADGQWIERLQFDGAGCTISMATASLLTERVVGMPVAELLDSSIYGLLPELERGVLTSRIRCASLALGLLKQGLHSYNSR